MNAGPFRSPLRRAIRRAPAQRIAAHVTCGAPLGRPWTRVLSKDAVVARHWRSLYPSSCRLPFPATFPASMSGVRGAAKESQEGKLQGAAASTQQGELKGVAAEQQSEKQQSGQGQVRASRLAPRSRAAAAARRAREPLEPRAQRPASVSRTGPQVGCVLGRRRAARYAALRARERRGDQLSRRSRCARLAFSSAFCIIAC